MTNTGVVTGRPETRTIEIDTDLSGAEYTLVALDTADDGVVNAAADAAAFPFVLLQGADGTAAAQVGVIAVGGRTKVKLGGTVTPGAKLTANATGEAIATTTAGDHFGLIAEANGVTGDIIPVTVEMGIV